MKTTTRLTTLLLLSLSLLFIGCKKDSCKCGTVKEAWATSVSDASAEQYGGSFIGWSITVKDNCDGEYKTFIYDDETVYTSNDNPQLPEKYEVGKIVCDY